MEHTKRSKRAAGGTVTLLCVAIVLFSFCRRAREESPEGKNPAPRSVEATTAARPASPSAPPPAAGPRRAAKPELQISVNGLQEGAVLYPGARALVEIRLRNARAQAVREAEEAPSGSAPAAQTASPLVVGAESRPWLAMVKVFGAPVDRREKSEPVELEIRWIQPKEAPPARLELDAEREGTATGFLEAAEIGRLAAGEYALFSELRADEAGPLPAGTFAGRVRSNPVAAKIASAGESPSEDDLDLQAYAEAAAARLEGNEDKARQAIAARLARNPGSIGMRILNAEILESEGRLAEALDDLHRASDALKARAGTPDEIKETPDLLIRLTARIEKKLAEGKK